MEVKFTWIIARRSCGAQTAGDRQGGARAAAGAALAARAAPPHLNRGQRGGQTGGGGRAGGGERSVRPLAAPAAPAVLRLSGNV